MAEIMMMLFIKGLLKTDWQKILLSNWAFKKGTVCGSLDIGPIRSQYWHCQARKGHCEMYARQL